MDGIQGRPGWAWIFILVRNSMRQQKVSAERRNIRKARSPYALVYWLSL
jgi:hypothetical protein